MMRRLRHSVTLACLLAAGCATPPPRDNARTIKSLEEQAIVVVHEAARSDKQQAMDAYRAFVEIAGDDVRRMQAMRRIADLQLMISEEEAPEEARAGAGGQGFATAAELYRDLLRDYPDYPDPDGVLYQMARAYDSAGAAEQELEALDRLVGEYPASPYYLEAQFRRGEILFVQRSYAEAEGAYRSVIAAGSKGSAFYEQALYKSGWSLFKQRRQEPALDAFMAVLDAKLASGSQFGEYLTPDVLSRADRELVEDTLRVIGLTFSEMEGVGAVNDYFSRHGHSPYEHLIYSSLGQLYIDKERYTDAGAAFHAFVEHNPNHAQAPLYQVRVYEIYEQAGFSSLALEAKQDFIRSYGPYSPFWKEHDIARMPVVAQHLKEEMFGVAQRYHADRVFIAVPSATNAQMQRIVGFCERAGVPFRTLPRLQDLVSGRIGLREVREVAIDDLLGRSAVQLDWDGIQRQLLGKTVLVTGGGGSIGAELCRQVARLGVAKLVLYERGEYPLYRIERELRRNFPHLALDAMLGDVCDAIALEHAFAAHRPHLVFHAAAYKHVPIVEAQIREGVRNNVLGTQNVVDAADRHGCEAMVLISTDKAVRPSSAMGATKRFAEMLCERRNLQSATRYVTVRFGNVLDSAGSVVPLFREQIRDGGPVTVTHPEATRYFMTIPEACQLILQAAAVGTGGDIFVLDMGDPVNITYLAEQMIRLSGRSPGQDIRIVYTGLRPGEKLREELFHADENLRQTPHPKLLLAGQTRLETTRIDRLYERLLQACDAFDEKELRELLTEAVPELSSGARSAVHDPRVVRFKRQQS